MYHHERDRSAAMSEGGDQSRGREADSATGREPPMRCATCGSPIDRTEWHPVTTRFGDRDEFHLYAFCRVACRREWQDG